MMEEQFLLRYAFFYDLELSDILLCDQGADANVVLDKGKFPADLFLMENEFIGNQVHGEFKNNTNYRTGGALALFGAGISCTIVQGIAIQ